MEYHFPHTVFIKIWEQGVEDSIFPCHRFYFFKLLLWELENVHITATL